MEDKLNLDLLLQKLKEMVGDLSYQKAIMDTQINQLISIVEKQDQEIKDLQSRLSLYRTEEEEE